ncbi:hypothetical protein HYV11_00940 [Candidatus Dependentiae bacterium]|nr:hypothetical protein [Candidatus Dependentiae bacterium]
MNKLYVKFLFIFLSSFCYSHSPIYNNIKNVIIVSPQSLVTGGAEALVQLFHELHQAGFTTHMLWISKFSEVKIKYDKGIAYLCPNSTNNGPEVYQIKYQTKSLANDIPLDQSTLVVLPEIWGNYIPLFKNAKIGFYWLSIEYFKSHPESSYYRSLIFEKKSDPWNCIHFSDAPWISKTIAEWGIQSYLLEVPISSHYLSTPQQRTKIENSIAYNPAKGFELAINFIKKHQDYYYIPLKNLDEQGVINALDSAKVYIDFGSFPGKDRIPREALTRNCVIFIHNAGCATDFDSFPIDNFFRFTDEEVKNGTLHNKIIYALQHYQEMLALQEPMKKTIIESHENFKNQINTIFGEPLKTS